MDAIDEQFRESINSTGAGFVRRTGSTFAADEPLRLHQQAGWHTNDSVQFSADAGQCPFASGAGHVNTVLSAGTITLVPIIHRPLSNPDAGSHIGLYIDYAGPSARFRIVLYADNNGISGDLVDETAWIDAYSSTYRYVYIGLKYSRLPYGSLVWLGVMVDTPHLIQVMAAVPYRTFGGCDSSGAFGSGVFMAWSSWPLPSP